MTYSSSIPVMSGVKSCQVQVFGFMIYHHNGYEVHGTVGSLSTSVVSHVMMQGIEKEVELIQETQEYSKVWYS